MSTVNAIHVTCQGVGGLISPESFGILMACSVALFVYMFCYSNMALVGLASDAVRQIILDLNTVVCPLTFVVFALMYKIAIRVSEEEDAFRRTCGEDWNHSSQYVHPQDR